MYPFYGCWTLEFQFYTAMKILIHVPGAHIYKTQVMYIGVELLAHSTLLV